MSWDRITDADASYLRSNLPGLRPISGALKVQNFGINYIEALSDKSVGVGWVEGGNPEECMPVGVYGLEELRIALEFAEAYGAESVHLVGGPRDPRGYPRLVLLCEDEDGHVRGRCVVVAPKDPGVGQREVV